MKNLKPLSKKEMSKVVGGVMDREATLDLCILQVELDTQDEPDPSVRALYRRVGEMVCWQNYYQMSA